MSWGASDWATASLKITNSARTIIVHVRGGSTIRGRVVKLNSGYGGTDKRISDVNATTAPWPQQLVMAVRLVAVRNAQFPCPCYAMP